MDFSKLKACDADSKAIQQINFTGNLARERNSKTKCSSLLKKQKNSF